VAGAIDLLYRDPSDGSWVVVDFKTDLVENASVLHEKRERYRGQAAAYTRAVQEALALTAPPRFELWFLDADRVERIEG
jgi:ATP-dependent exoDNAse (exonuclease V) beta subunit